LSVYFMSQNDFLSVEQQPVQQQERRLEHLRQTAALHLHNAP